MSISVNVLSGLLLLSLLSTSDPARVHIKSSRLLSAVAFIPSASLKQNSAAERNDLSLHLYSSIGSYSTSGEDDSVINSSAGSGRSSSSTLAQVLYAQRMADKAPPSLVFVDEYTQNIVMIASTRHPVLSTAAVQPHCTLFDSWESSGTAYRLAGYPPDSQYVRIKVRDMIERHRLEYGELPSRYKLCCTISDLLTTCICSTVADNVGDSDNNIDVSTAVARPLAVHSIVAGFEHRTNENSLIPNGGLKPYIVTIDCFGRVQQHKKYALAGLVHSKEKETRTGTSSSSLLRIKDELNKLVTTFDNVSIDNMGTNSRSRSGNGNNNDENELLKRCLPLLQSLQEDFTLPDDVAFEICIIKPTKEITQHILRGGVKLGSARQCASSKL